MTGKKLTSEVKQKIRESHLGLKQSSEWIEKRIRKGKDHYMYGQKVPAVTRKKIRLSILKRIAELKGKVTPRYNPNACKQINDYGKQHGVDGYDKEKNVVVEYYEKWHKGTQAHDMQRKQEIISQLGCKFIEICE
jgi:Ni/Co efflux regulator RcnB